MKTVRINQGNVGIVYRNGDFNRVVQQGKYWLKSSESVMIHDLEHKIVPSVNVEQLLKNELFSEFVDVISVGEEEIVVSLLDGCFDQLLPTGKHLFWKIRSKRELFRFDTSELEVPDALSRAILNKAQVQCFIRSFVIAEHERGVLLVDGEFVRELGAGTYWFWKNTRIVSVLKVDVRQQRMELGGQELLTQDKATIRVNVEATYQVVKVRDVLINSKDFEKQLYVYIQMAVREYIGTRTLDELLESKESIGELVMKSVATKAQILGVRLIDAGIKDVVLPGDIKEIMIQVLVAQKQAQANVITRREETASTRSQLNTAKLMEENPMLLKMKEMEYVEKIAERINTISLSGGGQMLDQLKEIFARN